MIPEQLLPAMEVREITFDPGPHTYVDETGAPYISVTTLIGKTVPVYNAKFWAMYRAIEQISTYKPRPFLESNEIEILYKNKRQKFSIDLLYSGVIPTAKKPSEITLEWQQITKESCEWGTVRHEYLESCVNKFSATNHIKFHTIVKKDLKVTYSFKVTNLEELENSPLIHTYPEIYTRIYKLVKDGWIAYAEKRVYSAFHRVAGTIDLLFVRGNECMILDWKTNREKIKFTPGYYKKEWNEDRTKKFRTNQWVDKEEYLLYPLDQIPYCKGMLYTMQLSVYLLLCEMWGLQPVGAILCHIRPELDENNEIKYDVIDGVKSRIEMPPEFFKINYLKSEALKLLNWQVNTFTFNKSRL